MITIEKLNEKFGIAGKVKFYKGKGGLTYHCQYHTCIAEISLYGAQLLSFKPGEQQDIIWMSEKSLFEPEKLYVAAFRCVSPGLAPTPLIKQNHSMALPGCNFGKLQR